MRKFACIAFALYLSATAFAAEVAGVMVADAVSLGGHTLVLNGAGLRSKFFFRIYVASLYVPQRAPDLAGVLAQSPRRIQMNLMRDVSAAQLVKALVGGLHENSSPAEMAEIAGPTDELVRILTSSSEWDVKAKDVVTLDFVDGGTRVAVNGADRGVIPGSAFNSALTRIWLGDKVRDHLKKAMLGGEARTIVPMPGQSVLVTGASGFIGGHLVRALIARGCRVCCLVRATSRVDDLRAMGAQVAVCDIGDRAGIARAIATANPSVVFHLAGRVLALDADAFQRVNADGVDVVAQACADQAAPPVLVLVSSLSAAGPAARRPRIESDPPAPVSDYGRSKLDGERFAAKHAGAVPIAIVRPCIVFGAGDRGVFEIWKPIARSGLHPVGGTGEQRVSLIAVQDLVACILRAAEQGERLVPGVAGQGIHFAAAEDLSYLELGTAIAAALGRPPPRIVHVPEWSMRAIGRAGDLVAQIRRRPGWVGSDKIREALAGSWTCSSAKAREQLGWSPAASLADRLSETARWYRDAHWLS